MTPTEIEARKHDLSDGAYQAACDAINRWLVSRAPTEGGEYFYDVTGMDEKLRGRLVLGYRAAGWSVYMNFDRDGSAMVLRARIRR